MNDESKYPVVYAVSVSDPLSFRIAQFNNLAAAVHKLAAKVEELEEQIKVQAE